MAENSKIEWTDHTFNPWIGCQKVSPGCDHCYAENFAKRYGWVEWGPHGARKRTSEENWKKPKQWAKAARAAGTRPRVFCASLADVFDNKAPAGARSDLFDLIASTPELDWLLLTKRPENFARYFPTGEWPNIWLGVTAEDQPAYDHRWPLLHEQRGVAVKFISYEPAIGPLLLHGNDGRHPDWIICGGESGHGYREMPRRWVDELRGECAAALVPFFFKQMAGKKPIPHDLMVREFPRAA